MKNATIVLKPINDLLGETFFVPAYQRGYRWTKRQVVDLLNDLWEFHATSEERDKGSFYCLQPVVVKQRKTGEWELVDGQQRLTTVFLILTFLKPLLDIIGKSRFALHFETRSETSGAFLQNIDPQFREANIDYYHICNAYDAIENWFSQRDGGHRLAFLQFLLRDDSLGRNVKVIWYELPDSDDPVAAFTRLNVGKIPLTNAELIRALFLQSGNFHTGTATLEQLSIAQEWDDIERKLQADAMWFFLQSRKGEVRTRIEYIFQLIAEESGVQAHRSDDPYATFHFYSERLAAGGETAAAEWRTVKQYFMQLEEWFNDRDVYHVAGYLIHEHDDLGVILQLGKDTPKSAFQRALRERIFQRVFGTLKPLAERPEAITGVIDELHYENDSAKIRSILLLFNIATIVGNSAAYMRFPFDCFKNGSWDIEHVRSVESGRPDKDSERRTWLTHVRAYLSSEGASVTSLVDRCDAVLASDLIDVQKFDQLYDELLMHFQEPNHGEADHFIGNLTLLDTTTNRSYKNAVFPVKRQTIIALDRSGTFVPLCTKNVFLKYYSKHIGDMMFWKEADSRDYREAIIATLVTFFSF